MRDLDELIASSGVKPSLMSVCAIYACGAITSNLNAAIVFIHIHFSHSTTNDFFLNFHIFQIPLVWFHL